MHVSFGHRIMGTCSHHYDRYARHLPQIDSLFVSLCIFSHTYTHTILRHYLHTLAPTHPPTHPPTHTHTHTFTATVYKSSSDKRKERERSRNPLLQMPPMALVCQKFGAPVSGCSPHITYTVLTLLIQS